MMELRAVTALLVLQYDIAFAPGEDGSELLNDSFEAFTIFLRDLRLIFKART